MRINPLVYGFMVLVIFLGTILGFQAAGVWSVSGKVTSSGDAVEPSAADVNSIKGWMTLEQVTRTYNIPLADLLRQFALPEDTPASTAIKDLESDLFSVTNLRAWLQSQLDARQVTSSESDGSTAVPVLTPDQPAATPTIAVTAAPTLVEHTAADQTVTGKTTFQDLLDWGVAQAAIEKVIGGTLPAPSVVVKDYVTGKGIEFPSIKTALQAEVDQVK